MANSSKASNKKVKKAQRLQYMVLGFVGLLVLAVLAYGLLYSSGVTEGEFAEGNHYELIEDAPKRRPSDPIVVTEYFSYGCIHCKDFDPMIEDWKPNLPPQASFQRAPVSFSPAWELLARAYLALETMDQLDGNHGRIFRAIHENGRQFLSSDQLGDFVARGGVNKAEFLRAFNGSSVNRRLSEIEVAMSNAGVRSVPSLVVAGKYRVNSGVGRKMSLAVVDHLVAKELAGDG